MFGHAVLHHLPDLPRAFAEFTACCGPGARSLFAGEPSLYGDRLAGVPKALGRSLAPVWRLALRAGPAARRPPASSEESLEPVVDVHAFSPASSRGWRGRPASSTRASAARSWSRTGSAG